MPQDKALVESCRRKVAAAAFSVSEYHIEYLAIVVDIIGNFHGSATPVEEFVTQLLSDYNHNWLTPKGVEDRLPEFRENVEMIAPAARVFARQFPELMKDPAEQEGE